VLATTGYNFRRLLAWLSSLLLRNPDRARFSCPAQIGLRRIFWAALAHAWLPKSAVSTG
jgi:hypothetical protein